MHDAVPVLRSSLVLAVLQGLTVIQAMTMDRRRIVYNQVTESVEKNQNTRISFLYIMIFDILQILIAKSPVAPFTHFVYTIQASGFVLQGRSVGVSMVTDKLMGNKRICFTLLIT